MTSFFSSSLARMAWYRLLVFSHRSSPELLLAPRPPPPSLAETPLVFLPPAGVSGEKPNPALPSLLSCGRGSFIPSPSRPNPSPSFHPIDRNIFNPLFSLSLTCNF